MAITTLRVRGDNFAFDKDRIQIFDVILEKRSNGKWVIFSKETGKRIPAKSIPKICLKTQKIAGGLKISPLQAIALIANQILKAFHFLKAEEFEKTIKLSGILAKGRVIDFFIQSTE